MTIARSTLVAANSLPTVPSDLWCPSSFASHDWSERLIVRSSWLTDIVGARSSSEKRRALIGKPYRSVDFRLVESTETPGFFLHQLIRRSTARTLTPLYCDRAHVTGSTTSSGDSVLTLSRPAADFRFHQYGWVLLHTPTPSRAGSFIVTYIESISGSTITVDGTTANTFVGAAVSGTVRAMPLMESRLLLNGSGALRTRSFVSGTMQALEDVGVVALDPLITAGTTPSGEDEYEDHPIFSPTINWSNGPTLAIMRDGETSDLGFGYVLDALGPKARLACEINVLNLDRTEAMRTLKFWDSRAGRAFPFWFAYPYRLGSLIEVREDEIDFESTEQTCDWSWLGHVYVRGEDGLQIAEVDSVSTTDGVDTLALAESISVPSHVSHVGPAALSRFDSDELQEEWLTDNAVSMNFSIVQVLNDGEVEIGLV